MILFTCSCINGSLVKKKKQSRRNCCNSARMEQEQVKNQAAEQLCWTSNQSTGSRQFTSPLALIHFLRCASCTSIRVAYRRRLPSNYCIMQIEQFRPCFIRRLFAVNFRRRSVTARLCVEKGKDVVSVCENTVENTGAREKFS